jgi:hypothetical protein
MNAGIDGNTRNTWALYNETTGLIEPARVDPVTGALEVFAVTADANSPTTFNRAGIDDNGRNTLSALNETQNIIEALRCGTDGSLLVTKQ